jgi:hypothetical protein
MDVVVVASDGISDLEIRCSFLHDVDVDYIVAADIADFVGAAAAAADFAVADFAVAAADRRHGRVRKTPSRGLEI